MPDTEVLSIETPPDISTGNGASDGLPCPDCEDSVAHGKLAKAHLTVHRKAKHGYVSPTPSKSHKKKATTERAPRVTPPTRAAAAAPATRGRRSAAKFLGPFWGLLGSRVPGRAGAVMMWQTPAAGEVLDESLKGTIVDRIILQRIAKEEGKWGNLSDLAILPAAGFLVDSGGFEKLPEPLQKMLMAQAQGAIVNQVEHILAAEAEQQRKLARLSAKAKDAGYEGLEQVVAQLMAALFGPAPQPQAPTTEPIYAPA